MNRPLFDEIHDYILHEDRNTPSTLDDFLTFGLELNDFIHYIGIAMGLQSDLLLKDRASKSPWISSLIAFCTKKKLIADSFADMEHNCGVEFWYNVMYEYEWINIPKSFDDFRLYLERTLSRFWDDEDIYIWKNFGGISIVFVGCIKSSEGGHAGIQKACRRIRRYDPVRNELVYLKKSEVIALLEKANQNFDCVNKTVENHMLSAPNVGDRILPDVIAWVQRINELWKEQELAESVCDLLEEAADTPDVYVMKESDTLVVLCGSDTCSEQHHHVTEMLVEFAFYGKPNRTYIIRRCAHCKKFIIMLDDLLMIHHEYGCPKCIVAYDGDSGSDDYSSFPSLSLLARKGYSVSEVGGLSAEKRHKILRDVIATGELNKQQVLEYLLRRMNINGMKPGNERAFMRWKDDYEFVTRL